MKNSLQTLSSPYIVAHFQRFCGVEWAEPDQENPLHPVQRIQVDKDCVTAYRIVIRNRFLYHTFHIFSEMAGRTFYYAFIPMCTWMLDVSVARKTLMELAAVMYIGQSAKDILRRPRPASPPVIRLEKIYETEYGMPSTHTMAGTVTPFALIAFSHHLYQIPMRQCLTAAGLWISGIGASRIYMGMHTPCQIWAGFTVAGSLVYLSKEWMNHFDKMLLDSTALTGATIVIVGIFSYIMFQLDSGLDPETNQPRWNTARGDTAEILGICAGFLAGSRWAILRNLYVHRSIGVKAMEIRIPDLKTFLLRFAVGGLMFFTLLKVYKRILIEILARISGVSLDDMPEAQKNPAIEFPLKYGVGLISGIVGTTVVPFVLNELQIW